MKLSEEEKIKFSQHVYDKYPPGAAQEVCHTLGLPIKIQCLHTKKPELSKRGDIAGGGVFEYLQWGYKCPDCGIELEPDTFKVKTF